jgi:peptidylprolyl isomerase
VSSIVWQDGDGVTPALEFTAPLEVTTPTVGVVALGEGEAVDLGDKIQYDMAIFSGADGSLSESTYADGETVTVIVTPDTTETALLQAFVNVNVGGRILYAIPGVINAEAFDLESTVEPSFGPTEIHAITVTSVTKLPKYASGTPMDLPADLPALTEGEDGEMSIAVPSTEPPTDLIVQQLIDGTGDVVQYGQTVAVRYTGWLWDGGTTFASNWTADAATAFPLDSALAGWRDSIVGYRIGSRVLAIVPPGMAYGGAGSDSVPPGATLIFLTDILDAY